MACFLVSAAEAAVVTAVAKTEEKKEIHESESGKIKEGDVSIPLSRKLKWLTYMLWGGVAMLAFEHIWHGEVAPWFPFLTAMSNPADAAEMLREIATVGVSMAVLITIIWACMCRIADSIVKRPSASAVQTDME